MSEGRYDKGALLGEVEALRAEVERLKAEITTMDDLRAAMEHVQSLPDGHTDEWAPREHLGHHVMWVVTDQALQKATARADAAEAALAGLVAAMNEMCDDPRFQAMDTPTGAIEDRLCALIAADHGDALRRAQEAVWNEGYDFGYGTGHDDLFDLTHNPYRCIESGEDE